MFNNYLKNPQNIAVNMEFLFTLKISEYFTANFGGELIYDDIISVPIVKEVNGVKETRFGKRIQLKEVFGICLAHNF